MISGNGEMFVGSDAIALAPLTSRITYLEEGDWAVVTRGGAQIHDSAGRLANRPSKTIQIDSAQVDKAGHRHFMAKEIAEQPSRLTSALDHYLAEDGTIRLPSILIPGDQAAAYAIVQNSSKAKRSTSNA